MKKKPINKTEKELLDEAMEKWADELEHEFEEINRNLLKESHIIDVYNSDDIVKYCSDCTIWDDFIKEWIK